MQGIININGYIGSFELEGVPIKGVDLIDVVSQVQQQPQATSFLVKINSKGGLCSVGYAIHDYLKTLGKPINTEATGFCCSMATIIMMAGEAREGIEPLDFKPHNPWTSGVEGDADALLSAHEEMRAEEDKMIAFYSKATGITKEGIDSIMKLDQSIPLEKAVELKFLTGIKQPLRAVALSSNKQNIMATIFETLNKKLDLLIKGTSKVEKTESKAVMLSGTGPDGSAVELEILQADGADFVGEPMPGDIAMIGGAPAPDGTYIFQDYSVEILMGAVVTVTPSAAAEAAKKALAEEEELKKKAMEAKTVDQKLIDENNALKDENAKLKADAEAFGKKLEGVEKALGVIKSTYEAPEGKTTFSKKGAEKEISDLKQEAAKRKELYKK